MAKKEELELQSDAKNQPDSNANISQNDEEDYDASDIQILKGLEGVRKRPSMYIGSTHKEGWHHLVWEVVDNSIDEVLPGFCDSINIAIRKDGSITIEDNGRGIPTEIHPDYNLPTLEVIIQNLHAGGKFKKGSYQISGGLHGVGLSVVSACSKWMNIEIIRDGVYYFQKFGQGKILSSLTEMSIEDYQKSDLFKQSQIQFNNKNPNNHSHISDTPSEENETNNNNSNEDDSSDYDSFFELGTELNSSGTRITFIPDDEIFTTLYEDEDERIFDFAQINNRLRNLAFLNPTVEIQFLDEVTQSYEYHHYEGGISEFAEYMNRGNKVLYDEPIYIHPNEPINGVDVEIAIQYTETYLENIITFVNNVSTPEGGTHLTGFKSSLTRTINNYVQNNKAKKLKDVSFQGSDVREGLTAILSAKVPEPQFEGQTKTKLGNEEVQGIVSGVMTDLFSKYLEEHPGIAGKIINKCMVAQKARIASKKARDLTRRKSALDSARLPGKLADCSSKDPIISELFIVEGDSAGGSAKQGRDSVTQAILPLRGKILNVEKASQHKIHENKEIRSLISAIGTGVYTNEDSDFKIGKLRYHKIIIMCDADVDGAHIKTLLLTFFFRYMRPLIEKGNIYVAVPPLYKVSYKKSSDYIYEDAKLEPYLKELKEKYKLDDASKIKIQRYKGLGEMNASELAETTMDPENRKLLKITYQDFAKAHQLFNTLMGDEVLPRKQFIMEHYKDVQNLDV